ncbi:MAG: pyridoxal phosphate-dependent aminotransferase [Acidobacteriota bacterium]|nr:pyridoxal phosphate-dependent aminotransferase [Acidobacteriota bacterium]MDQ2978191.1 pyridoxal phosphate-dependent aminotransferase [Acidobacteriota bacterium]
MSPLRLSRRVEQLCPSSTAAVGKAAKALAASGVDVVDFGLGEPDFPTPDFVARAGIAAIEKGLTKYTDTAGAPPLRDAIAEKYRREQGAACTGENVLVTAGAKQAVFNACQALFDPGDAVALFSPYWVSFPEMVRLAGARPVFVETRLEERWRPAAEQLERLAEPRLRGVIVNSPNNPTGAVLGRRELERILDWCAARDAVLIFDETYDRFLYEGGEHVSAAAFWGEHGARVVVTGAASKTYAMTGWRLGWALAPKDLVLAMSAYQSHSTSNASSISQEAGLLAFGDLERSDASVAAMLAEYALRREAMLSALSKIDGVAVSPPEGAFYTFPRVSGIFQRKGVAGSEELCRRLLAEAHVAAVPGQAFGDDACVRLSFATSLDRIREGMKRFVAWAA